MRLPIHAARRLVDTDRMSYYTEPVLKALKGREDCRRSSGRQRLEALRCNLGPVLDLSAGGMRVLSKRSRSGELLVTLRSFGRKVTVAAKVAWSRRIGFRRHLVGLSFTNVNPDSIKALNQLSCDHRRVLGDAA
jgi:hypothetical protein